MRTTASSAALALLLGLGLALPAAAQQQQQQQQPAAQQGQQGQQGQQQPTAAQPGQEMQAEATVATIDQTSLKLSTEEGDEYTLAEGNLVRGLQPGTKVRITYHEQDGQKHVTHIEPVQQ